MHIPWYDEVECLHFSMIIYQVQLIYKLAFYLLLLYNGNVDY
jgi:hypothetical protein